jgi:hypothetical protein
MIRLKVGNAVPAVPQNTVSLAAGAVKFVNTGKYEIAY